MIHKEQRRTRYSHTSFLCHYFIKEQQKNWSKAPKPDNLSSVAKPSCSCENYGCRKNCFEDSELRYKIAKIQIQLIFLTCLCC